MTEELKELKEVKQLLTLAEYREDAAWVEELMEEKWRILQEVSN